MLTARERLSVLGELSFWLALAGVAYGLTFDFAGETGTYAWGAASWPRAIILIMVLGAMLHAGLRARTLRRQAPNAPGRRRRLGSGFDLGATLSLTAMFALPLVYLLLLPGVGFYVSTPIFLALYLALLGERRPGFLLGVPLAIFAIINLVFTVLFFVALPVGTWPGFYEASNWFLVALR